MSSSIKLRQVGHLQLLSRAKQPLTIMAQKKVCPRDEEADPPSTNVFPVDRYSFAEGFVLFVHYVVCNRRRRDLLGIVGSSAVPSRSRRGKKPCVSCLRRSELSTQVRQHDYYIYYSQEYGEGVPMAPRPNFFVVR